MVIIPAGETVPLKTLPQNLVEVFGSELFDGEPNDPGTADYFRAFKRRPDGSRIGSPRIVRGPVFPPAPPAKFFAGRQGELISADELVKLRKLNKEIEAIRADLDMICTTKAGDKKRADVSKYLESPTSANLEALAQSRALDSEHFREYQRQLRRACKQALQKKCEECHPLCRTILERAALLVEKEIPAVANAEKKIADHYGVPFILSGVPRALHSLAMSLRRFSAGFGSGPSQLLQGLVKL